MKNLYFTMRFLFLSKEKFLYRAKKMHFSKNYLGL